MLQPRAIKKNIQNILNNDNYIINTLKFNKELMLLRKDIAESFDYTKKYINIYEKPSERTVNPLVRMTVFQVDIIVSNKIPDSNANIAYADLCAEQIQCLLHDNQIISGIILEFLGSVGNVATNPTQYQVGLQFGAYEIVGGKPKA